MSQLKVDTIQGNTSSTVYVNSPSSIYSPGACIQTRWKISMDRIYYRSQNNDTRPGPSDTTARPTSCNATLIEAMEITILPKSVNSWIYVEFNMMFESQQDSTLAIARNGNLIGSGMALQQVPEAGIYDTWMNSNGIGVPHYDANDDSTPMNTVWGWWDRPFSLQPVTYTPTLMAANNRSVNFVLNCTFSNYQYGSDNYEQGCSFSRLEEYAVPQA